jgi:hypothetical protein
MDLQIQSRKDFPHLLNELGLLDFAVEVGVHEGSFSDYILSNWDGKTLCSVDPWKHQEDVYQDASNVSQDEHDVAYRVCKERLGRFKKRSLILRMSSVAASTMHNDKVLDFVYLDARHDYRSVADDLAVWHPKVKKGGILAGHDFFNRKSRRNLVEVERAVRDHFYNTGYEIHQTDEHCPSWYVQV